jgi:S-formylglutathione hydrolase FrmB/lysophospholipase L1-like esterase
MKKLILLLLFVIAFSAVFAGQNDILTITHYSQSLNREKTFQIYFPPDATESERFPVLFVLHGAYGNYTNWVNRTNIEDLADNYRMILVFPDGGEFGWYVDSPIEQDSQYESYVAVELVAEIDRLFPTIASREGRGIMGLSMGGHGALLLAAKHPDVFGSASAMSGILKITDDPEKWHIAGRLGELEKNRKAWKANSVWDQAKRFKKANVELLFDCGTSDTITGAIGDSRQVHERLVSMKVPHIWREMSGTHSWNYWQTHLGEHLNFHQAAMAEVTPDLGKWRALYFARLSEFFEENSILTLRSPKKPTLCLLGSSSMQGFPIELLKGYRVFNRGISADTLGTGSRGISHRLEPSVFDMSPDFVFIKNGRNDLGDRHRTGQPSIERMVEEYTQIVLTIRERLPKTKLFIVTCAPVRDKYAHLATATHSFNMQLKFLANTYEIPVLDLYEALVDSDGLLRPEYSRDGLHLSRAGYELWAEMMIDAMSGEEHRSKKPR